MPMRIFYSSHLIQTFFSRIDHKQKNKIRMYVYNGEKRYQLLLLFTLPVLPANQWICLLSKIMTYKEVAKSTHDEKKNNNSRVQMRFILWIQDYEINTATNYLGLGSVCNIISWWLVLPPLDLANAQICMHLNGSLSL